MPKYYRFRALTPTRKPRRSAHSQSKEVKELEKVEQDRSWIESLSLACAPAPAWYMRRTSWRQSPSLLAFPRQLSASLRACIHLSNRSIFMLKIPVNEILKL